jgi:histidine triad (HIT) family protein
VVEAAQTDCFICGQRRGEEPVPGGAIHEDPLVVAVHAYHPERNPAPYLGHVLVEPIRHAYGVAELADDEAAAIGVGVTRVARALKRAQGAEHVYVAVMGHHTPHLHVHLIPRYPGTPREYWSPLTLDEWPDGRHGGADEIAAVVERVRAAL